jgi:hypothetical protein
MNLFILAIFGFLFLVTWIVSMYFSLEKHQRRYFSPYIKAFKQKWKYIKR